MRMGEPRLSAERQLAEEGLEWCKDWREGIFTPAPTQDGWTVEMYGLVDSHEKLCRAYLLERERAERLERELAAVQRAYPDVKDFLYTHRALSAASTANLGKPSEVIGAMGSSGHLSSRKGREDG